MAAAACRSRRGYRSRSPNPSPSHIGGFTLIELGIGIAVLAVLAVMAAPNVGARLQHQRLLAAAQALAADVADARFEAAQRGGGLHLQSRSGPGADWCWAVTTAPNCGCSSSAGVPKTACQLRNVPAAEHPGVRLVDAGDVQFGSAANTASAAAPRPLALLESAAGERLRVELSALGRPRVCAVSGRWAQLPGC